MVESGFEENLPKTSAGEYAQRTALHKALDVARSMHGKFDLIIAADTVVQVGDRILEKPNDDEHAAEMLESLSGRRHQVCTGVVLLTQHGEPTSFVEMTDVSFASLTTAGIEAYIATGELHRCMYGDVDAITQPCIQRARTSGAQGRVVEKPGLTGSREQPHVSWNGSRDATITLSDFLYLRFPRLSPVLWVRRSWDNQRIDR